MRLTEIKKGQVGTGLLVENDGYISVKDNKLVLESVTDNGWNVPYPFEVSAVFQKYGIENANGRIYPEHILKREVEKYMEMIKTDSSFGELNHPESSTIDLGRVALKITHFEWKGHTLCGKIVIPVSEGYRKLGIVSCCADMLAHHILSGMRVGVSSRGLGSVTKIGDKLVVGDDYEIVCWDAVSTPSTPNAWIETDERKLGMYVESVEPDKKKVLSEDKYTKFDKWLFG